MVVAVKTYRAMEYAEGVRSGAIPACKWVRLAVARHYHDLEHAHERGLWFDENAAKRVIDFFGFLHHSKGEWGGQVFVLDPWQQFLLWVLFGWKRNDGTRRFRVSYCEISRKNGKSTLASGVGLYLFFADQEAGAEVYSIATKLDQAKLVHGEAMRMVKSSPGLAKRIKSFKNNLSVEKTDSKFEPLGADEDTLDGLNIHGVIVDELHAHKNRKVYDVIDTSSGARSQPMLFAITTAGYDRQSVCWEQHSYAEKVLQGFDTPDGMKDDTFFSIMYTLDLESTPGADDGDDWKDESCWIKANPSLGTCRKLDDLQQKVAKAINSPASENGVKRLYFDIWTQQASRLIDMDLWRSCNKPVDPEALRGMTCYVGVDLGWRDDFAASSAVFRVANEFHVLLKLWCCENGKRRLTDHPFKQWIDSGILEVTDANSTDVEAIQDFIRDDWGAKYEIKQIAFDPNNARATGNWFIEQGFDAYSFPQNSKHYNEPIIEFIKCMKEGRFRHGSNAALTWMADNVVTIENRFGEVMPCKAKCQEKIDGIVAMLMAFAMAVMKEGEGPSVYETRGLATT